MKITVDVEDLLRQDNVGRINRKLVANLMYLTSAPKPVQATQEPQKTAEATENAPEAKAATAPANEAQKAPEKAEEKGQKMSPETRQSVTAAVVALRADAKKLNCLTEVSAQLRDFLNSKVTAAPGQRITIDDLDEETGRAYAELARKLDEEIVQR